MSGDQDNTRWKRWLSVLLLVTAVILLFMALPLPGRAQAGPAADIRQVVVIDLGAIRTGALGCYGSLIPTPSIDAVADRGMRYTNCVAVGAGLRSLQKLLQANGFVTIDFDLDQGWPSALDEHDRDQVLVVAHGDPNTVVYTDSLIGEVLTEIEDLPGQPLLIITGSRREGQANVPLVIACEGVVPAGLHKSLVADIDLAPTVLDLLGLPIAGLELHSRSLTRTFKKPDPWPDRTIGQGS